MPSAFDRSIPADDHSPLANQMDFDPSKPLFDIGSILDAWLSSLQEFVFPAILELTGIDLSSPEAFFGSVALLIINGGAEALAFVNAIVGGIAAGIQSLIANLLNGGQAINVSNLFGSLAAGLFGLIPASAVGSTQPNLLTSPLFATEDSVIGQDTWVWDGTEGHDGDGSAKAAADGSVKYLRSNEILVEAGHKFSFSAWTKWSGLAATGSPISIIVEYYDAAGDVVSSPTIDSVSAPGVSGGWEQLTGTSTVPAGVVKARLRLNVGATATDGVVWFDDISAKKTNKIGFSLIADENGNGLPDIIDGLVDGTAFQELKDALAGIGGGGLVDIINRLEAFLTPASPVNGANIIGDILDDVLPGLQNLFNNIGGIFSGLGGGGWDRALTAGAIEQQASITQGLAAKVAVLEGAFTGGVTAGDDFERPAASNLGANWAMSYTAGPGDWRLDGHDAYWQEVAFGTAARTFIGRWQGPNATSATDYQRITLVLSSQPQNTGVGSSPGANDVLGRMDSGSTNYVRARWYGNGTVAISRVVGGVETVMNSGSSPNPGGGASLTLECGKPGVNVRYFRALLNGVPVLEVTEVGTASMAGASYRGWGHGCMAGTDPLNVPPQQNSPGKLKQWTAADLTGA